MNKVCTLAGAQPAESNTSPKNSGYWAQAPFPRDRHPLFSPTLDEVIPDDHLVRLLDEVLLCLDWTEWKRRHTRKKGNLPSILAWSPNR